ncbi:uncharacterized protein LOC120161792 [Hibiscus syriacus]|uniref:uncharacterized protein LOC120161792 n=1 Tax=Hibiscus syriacus TaxID=106335 RepID=UPI001920C170|nr:uncharacterized protein LOC120161792 [Hibiscus syriacus]
MVSFKYWDECVDPEDLEAMWNQHAVRKEWTNVGETQGQKVHLSRDPDGQPYLTQTEMRAVAEIVTSRHFDTHIEPEMISAIAELESNRQPLAMQYDKKAKVTTVGIMQICPTTAEWLVRECHISLYKVEEDLDILYRPFVNVYLGATYLKWLSNFENKVRTEEFIIRAYKGGTKKATHKSTLPYWKRYLSVKETSTPRYRKHSDAPPITRTLNSTTAPVSIDSEDDCLYWDSRVYPEDMKQMWNCHEICNEWNKANQKRGKVLFTLDNEKKPCLTRLELKTVAETIVSRYFSTKGIKPSVLCALAEMVSMRYIDGIEGRIGLMGIDYSTSFRLYTELGFRDYPVDYVEDLTKPFVSMYFGTAYFSWLSMYEGSERNLQFTIQAYISGPEKVNLEAKCPHWEKFEQALTMYNMRDRNGGRCTVM